MTITLAGRYNRPMHLGTVVGIGWRAADVLAGERLAHVVAPMRASIYVRARGELLWLGGPAELMHCRAVLFAVAPDASAVAAGDTMSVPPCTAPPWRPDSPTTDAREALRRGAERLVGKVAALGEPRGFGAWLVDSALGFPLTGAGKAADALAAACARDDASAAAHAARDLLGLGDGLTPSGDDFVGGAFFARAMLTQRGEADGAAWRQAASAVRTAASGATNAISAALLGDLLVGHGWSPLHDLVGAFICDDEASAMDAASRLARLGHSSGWDLLAGLVAGLR